MNLLKIIMLVVVSPRIGWDEMNRSSVKTSDILSKAFFPMLIFLALTAFAPLIYDANLTFVSAIISSIFHFSAYFLSYYLVSYLLGGFYPELVKTKAGKGRVNDFILFNLIYLMFLSIIENLLPIDFTPGLFMMLYVIWLVNVGAPYLGIKEEKKNKFVFIASAMLLVAPIFLHLIH